MLVEGLDQAAGERPVLVVIDDLHWADAGSLELLRSLGPLLPAGCLAVVAVRSSFLDSVPWLQGRSHLLWLPALSHAERASLLSSLLPAGATERRQREILASRCSSNPLYLQQVVAYLAEAGSDVQVPSTLHQVVLRRLELIKARIDRPAYGRLSSGEIAAIETTVGEWLDRLETEDYDDRAAIATYLALLEQIDVALLAAGSLAGVVQHRNRRLTRTIERFYSAGFVERVKVLQALGEHDPTGAAFASARGAHQARASGRIEDALAYLEMATRFAHGSQRHRYLIELGDLRLARAEQRQAFHNYVGALRVAADHRQRALSQQRLARAVLSTGWWRAPRGLLDAALPHLSGDEALAARCDLALTLGLAGNPAGAEASLAALDRQRKSPPTTISSATEHRARLRLGLLRGAADLDWRAGRSASTTVLCGDRVWDAACLVETAALLRAACPERVDPTLLEAARDCARGLAGRETGSQRHALDLNWPPLLMAV